MSESVKTDSGTISGRIVVIAMFSLGILATAILWTYWTVRMTPYMPLQEALEREFRDCLPRVEGGTLKKTGDSVLKVVLRSSFDPRAESEASKSAILDRLERTRLLATELADLPNYRILALTLYFPTKERGISQKTFFRQVSTWKELDASTLIERRHDPALETQPAPASTRL